MKWLRKFIDYILEDIFILGGLGIIIWQTYQLNQIVAIYMLGSILFIYGVMLGMRR